MRANLQATIPETEVRTLADFLVEARQIREHDAEELWFRGHDRLGQSLTPRVFRDASRGGPHGFEWDLTNIFRLRACSRHPHCPDRTDHPSWLFLMQHYGLPTRLLDWTASPLVAAYFAVRDRRSDPKDKQRTIPACEVVALRAAFLNDYELRFPFIKRLLRALPRTKLKNILQTRTSDPEWVDPWGPDYEHLFDRPFESPGSRGAGARGVPAHVILAIKPVELDPRVVVQASRFTIHGRKLPLETHDIADIMLHRFVIPGDARGDLEMQLRDLNVKASTLFPDLDRLSQDLRVFGDR